MRDFVGAYPNFSFLQVSLAKFIWYHSMMLLEIMRQPEIEKKLLRVFLYYN
jgi:hypothetical protein